MMSYRFKRRSFLQGVGGAVGLKIMLRNLEAGAQTTKSPPRMLVTHWPVGVVRTGFAPTSGSVGGSPILKPFVDMNMGADMTVFMGVSTAGLASNGGGGHEAGTVKMMTGVACPGTRSGLPEGDDAYSGGPSYDQIFLKSAATILKQPGKGYANSIADSRVDFLETSTQCLSYDYMTQPVARVGGTTGTENVPLLPVLSPIQQWMNLFSGIVPGGTGGLGGTTGVNTAMLTQLYQNQSVLDFMHKELDQLKTLCPASEAPKIDIQTQAIRDMELQVGDQLRGASGAGGASGSGSAGCVIPPSPPAVLGKSGSMNNYGIGNDDATTEDGPTHALVAQAHMNVLKAAMVCDLIRVGTFQYSPGTNHVSFKGMMPAEPNTIYMHHPVSHRIGTADTTVATLGAVAQFLANIQTWYYLQHATIMSQWKTQLDGMGNSLLDNTIVPFVTEVQATGHEQNNMAAMLIGGKSLGFTHGTYKAGNYTINQFWGTVAQAFGLAPAGSIGTPIAGCWVRPPA